MLKKLKYTIKIGIIFCSSNFLLYICNWKQIVKEMDGVIYGFVGAFIILGIAYALAIYQSKND